MFNQFLIKIVQAQINCGDGFKNQDGICIPDKANDTTIFRNADTISGLVTTLVYYALAIAGIVAVVYVIIGGFKYLTAGGNEENTETGRKYVINALIGLAVVLLGSVLVRVVVNLLTSRTI